MSEEKEERVGRIQTERGRRREGEGVGRGNRERW